jgi:plastocyanin
MRFPLIITLLCYLMLSASAIGDGHAVIEGRVKLPAVRTAPVKIQRYDVVTTGGVVALNPPLAVVYLEGQFASAAPAPKVQMIQKNFAFVPTLLPIRVGTTVEFPNQDNTYHNIFSYSKPKRFDLGRYLPTETPIPSEVFDKAGLVQLHCEIHHHMQAVILVLETPYFVTTDAEGRFRLEGLPAGNYKLKAWMDSGRTLELPVELKSGSTTHADFP